MRESLTKAILKVLKERNSQKVTIGKNYNDPVFASTIGSDEFDFALAPTNGDYKRYWTKNGEDPPEEPERVKKLLVLMKNTYGELLRQGNRKGAKEVGDAIHNLWLKYNPPTSR